MVTVKTSDEVGRKWPTAVDLFSGSGAVSAALKRRHFRVVAAVDNDPIACGTYRLNHPNTPVFEDDIEDVDPNTIRSEYLGGRDVDLLIVCAPCQPFSSQNRKRAPDTRSRLILQAGRFARVLRPKLIFFENVPGLASASTLLDELRESLGPDYSLGAPHRVDAADYGVPQRRIRCIMMASRMGPPPAPPPALTPKGKRATVKGAIGHLARLGSGESDSADTLHRARSHQPIALQRLRAVPKDGGSRSSLPVELQLACHQAVAVTKFSDVYGRMSWSDTAPTLTTGCTDITRGRFAHPHDDRAITLREAALLQTFAPNYQFMGSASDIATQIGNAVPTKLIEAFVPVFRQVVSAA